LRRDAAGNERRRRNRARQYDIKTKTSELHNVKFCKGPNENHFVVESSIKDSQGRRQDSKNCAEHIEGLLDGEGAGQKFQHRDLGPKRKKELDGFCERVVRRTFPAS
jgi:hypothetical protein